MRTSSSPALIVAFTIMLPLFSASLPADDAPVMRAENLGDRPLFKQPLLIAVANLDQRISTTTNTVDRARLTHQRARVLEQLNRNILYHGGSGFTAALPADKLQRLRDTVSGARRSGDKTAEMTAILRLNNAILDQSFAHLLATVADDWIRFAPAANFNRAFDSFQHRTAFDQVPFGRAVQHLRAAGSATRSDTEQALIDAYRDYSQRAEVYDAVAQSLFSFVKNAATSNRLLQWLGISRLIGTIDAQPWAIDINARMLPDNRYSMGQLISIGQIFAAVLLFLALIGVGLILLPVLLRLLRRALPQRTQRAAQDRNDSERFFRLLQQSFLGPLRILLVLIAIAQATRILFLRESDERILNLIDSLYVVLILWMLLRLIDNFVMLYSSELLRRHPTLRGELINFLTSMTRFLVIAIALL